MARRVTLDIYIRSDTNAEAKSIVSTMLKPISHPFVFGYTITDVRLTSFVPFVVEEDDDDDEPA